MTDNEDALQLSRCCFDACEALKAAILGKNADDLDESMKVAMKDIEK